MVRSGVITIKVTTTMIDTVPNLQAQFLKLLGSSLMPQVLPPRNQGLLGGAWVVISNP